MKASVIMPVYNERLDWLQYAIDSVLNQTFTDFEFLIVLDNPKREDLYYFLKMVESKDTRVRIYVNEVNLGTAKSLNRLLSLCQGDYIFRMDADDVCEPTRFAKQLAFMELNHLDFSATHLQGMDSDGKVIGKPVNIANLGSKTIKRAFRECPLLPHPTWCLKKEIYQTLGGYREIPAIEDYDFIIRAIYVANVKIGILGESLLRYRLRYSSLSNKNAYRQFVYHQAMSSNIRDVLSKDVTFINGDLFTKFEHQISQAFWHTHKEFISNYHRKRYKALLKAILKEPRLFRVFLKQLRATFWLSYGKKHDVLLSPSDLKD